MPSIILKSRLQKVQVSSRCRWAALLNFLFFRSKFQNYRSPRDIRQLLRNIMNMIRKIWNNFKSQPDLWFFYGFLATFTLSIRKVLFFYPINNQFNEYTGIYLYLSDILLILAILAWVIVLLCNKYSILSILKTPNVPPQEECSTWNNFRGSHGIILIPAIFVLWSFISILWSTSPNVAFFRSFKLLEFYLLFLYIIIRIVPRGTILINLLKILVATGIIQSVLGIWQFIIQQSIGFDWLKESLISPDIIGVAKVILDNDRIVRAYGLFQHPNILGGFLALSITLTIAYYKMFHVEQSDNSTANIKCSTWNNNHCEVYTPTKNTFQTTQMFHVEQLSRILSCLRQPFNLNKGLTYKTILTIQIVAIFLTFSKSAVLGLLIAIFYIYTQRIVPRGTKITQQIQKLFHVEHFGRKLFLVLGIILMLVIITKPDINSLLFKSLDERMLYINVSRGTISNNPIFGVGSGQFVATMQNYTNQALSDWQFQPVHNVFLLIWSELGLIGLSLFILFLWKLFHVEQLPKSTKTKFNIKCSTWNNNRCEIYTKKQNVPRGTFSSRLNVARVFRGSQAHWMCIGCSEEFCWVSYSSCFLIITCGTSSKDK